MPNLVALGKTILVLAGVSKFFCDAGTLPLWDGDRDDPLPHPSHCAIPVILRETGGA